MAGFDEAAAQIEHDGYIFGGAGLDIGPLHIEAIHVFMESGDIGFGYFRAAHAFAIGTGDNFIVHVREVADKSHGVALMPQIARQHVEDHGRTGMADVAVVVGRDPAGVHAHPAGPQRFENFLAARHRIVQLHGYSRRERTGREGNLGKMPSPIPPSFPAFPQGAVRAPGEAALRSRCHC